MIDKFGDLIDTFNRTTTMVEMSGPMSGVAAGVEDSTSNLISPGLDQVAISSMDSLQRSKLHCVFVGASCICASSALLHDSDSALLSRDSYCIDSPGVCLPRGSRWILIQ